MPIIARDNSKAIRPAPEGLHNAVCCDVVDKGLQTSSFGTAHKVELRWQLEAKDPETGRRHMVIAWYTLSLNVKSNLSKLLEAWRGKAFTKEERAGFDVDAVIGAPCQIQVNHQIDDEGGRRARVQAVVQHNPKLERLRVENYVKVRDRADEHDNGGDPFAPEATDDVALEERLPF